MYFLFCFPVQLLYQSGSEAEVDLDPFVEDSDEELNQTDHQQSETSRIVTLIVAFLLKFQIFYKISDNAIVTLLRFFKYLLLIVGKKFWSTSTATKPVHPSEHTWLSLIIRNCT